MTIREVGTQFQFMKYFNVRLISLFIICYALALAALTPIQWLMPIIEPRVSPLGVTIEHAEGSIWSGSGLVKVKPYGSAAVDWDVQVLGMLLLRLPINLDIVNEDLDVSAKITPSLTGLAVSNVNGYVDDGAVEQITKSYNSNISGRLKLDNLSANASWSLKLGEASGNVSWSGGDIAIPVGRTKQNYEVPMMLGGISSDDTKWLLDIRGQSGQEYIGISLLRDGLATLSVKRQLATDMNIPIPGNGQSLMDISQKVFNGP